MYVYCIIYQVSMYWKKKKIKSYRLVATKIMLLSTKEKPARTGCWFRYTFNGGAAAVPCRLYSEQFVAFQTQTEN